MNRLFIRLVSRRKSTDGEAYLKPPVKGWRKKLFDFFSEREFKKRFKNLERFELSELFNVLEKAIDLFKQDNHAFQIDINKGKFVDLQIIHPSMLSQNVSINNPNEFGFVVYWTCDTTLLETDFRIHERFTKSKDLSDYIHFRLDDSIDCYAYLCAENKESVFQLVKSLMIDVYMYKETDKYYFSLVDHGSVVQ